MLLNFFMEAGPTAIVITLLAGLLAVLVITNIIRLALVDGPPYSKARGSVDAILFWGSISAAFGLLGTGRGMLIGSKAVMHAKTLSPMMVAQGCSEALLPTIFGLTVFLVSALLWFAFRSWIRRLESQTGG
ncbi:MAG: MotA/TolQ/ExbB proton channel family protein [bacterium]|nr:MotA/TolQ/ExbB proton channel family protein [bacterium]